MFRSRPIVRLALAGTALVALAAAMPGIARCWPVDASDRVLSANTALTEFLDASVSHVRSKQIQAFEFGQPLELLQPGVGYFRIHQVERSELSQPFEVRQPGVGYPGPLQQKILREEDFVRGRISTSFMNRFLAPAATAETDK